MLCSCASTAHDEVKAFIMEHWDETIRENHESPDGTLIPLPLPYSVPCANGMFQEMYYWDTFFTNEGLILSGRADQAKANTENIAYLIETYGFMPNGTRTWYLNRSQPPYFALMVDAVHKACGDEQWLAKMYPTLKKEYGFWMTQRMTPCGLNRYSSEADENLVAEFVQTGSKRIGADFSGKTPEELYTTGRHFAAEAESGWDFTPRFERRCEDFCPVDLNANLYFYETFLADLAGKFGEDPTQYRLNAEKRKENIFKYMLNSENGCFYDYDYVSGRHSEILSGAVFNLLVAGIPNARQASRLVSMALHQMETEHGVAATAPFESPYTYQWAYPNSWPPVQYMAERGLMQYGFTSDAQRLARKYTGMVSNVFKTSGNLWEKYNLLDGSVVDGVEYDTPAMLGWTAGAYLYSLEFIEKQ